MSAPLPDREPATSSAFAPFSPDSDLAEARASAIPATTE